MGMQLVGEAAAAADGTMLMGFLDQCSLFLLEPAEDIKIRFTLCISY